MINLEKAKYNPASVFSHPKDVINCHDLSREQQIDILRQWAYDERELQVAEEENMRSTTNGRTHILEDILHCLIKLGANEQDLPPPTKQG